VEQSGSKEVNPIADTYIGK
jgi:GNAT superfamily N-acetyltransferase